jgi:hypothetical protein
MSVRYVGESERQISITTTIYAALHSRARRPIRRLVRRIESQWENIANDLHEDEAEYVSKSEDCADFRTMTTKLHQDTSEPKIRPHERLRPILQPRSQRPTYVDQTMNVKQETVVWPPRSLKIPQVDDLHMGRIDSGVSFRREKVHRSRGRNCVSVPP